MVEYSIESIRTAFLLKDERTLLIFTEILLAFTEIFISFSHNYLYSTVTIDLDSYECLSVNNTSNIVIDGSNISRC